VRRLDSSEPTVMRTFPTAPLSTAACASAASSRLKRCSGNGPAEGRRSVLRDMIAASWI